MPARSIFTRHSESRFSFNKHLIETILGDAFCNNNTVQLLESGQAIFQAITESLSAAKIFICIEFYMFKDDETGKKLAQILKEKSRNGVKVYLLYDHFGSFLTANKFWSDMKKAGIMFRVSHPFKFSSPRSYFYRNHKKLLIIDGETAFTGGFNIADEYYGYFKNKQKAWRDIGICLKGPIVNIMLERFMKSWERWKGKPIIQDTLPQIFTGELQVIPIFASTGRARRRMRRLFVQSIKNSKKSICLTTPYFLPGRRVLRAIVSAARKGVKLKLLLPGKSDVKSVDYASRASYEKLLKSGVEIYNYQGTVLHAKTALFDDMWSIIGSTNLDYQSLLRNDESNIGILNKDFGLKMKDIFESDLKKSIMIDQHSWENRPLYQKVLEKVFFIILKKL